ncbi:MAG: hypothetical protein JSU98_05600 [Gemmatimonadales bacterium]|nr:MAG: hypothetical protein JSU98_05600 [Gemmatimonadales bacterium]
MNARRMRSLLHRQAGAGLPLGLVRWAAMAVAGLGGASPGTAQSLYLEVQGDRSTFNEALADDRLTGFGAAGSARWDGGTWEVEGEVAWRSMSPAAEDRDGSVTFLSGGVRGRYAVWRTLSVELGWESRTADPQFAAQDLGMALLGLHYGTQLTSLADLWVRGAAIPFSSFNGGGEASIGIGLGMGLRVGPPTAAWRAVLEYGFRRIDRTVRDVDVPIQVEGIRIGVEYAVF